MPQVARSEHLSEDAKIHLLHYNKHLIVCRLDKSYGKPIRRDCLYSKHSQRFTVYWWLDVIVEIPFVLLSYPTFQSLLAVTRAFSLLLLLAVSNYSGVVLCYSFLQNAVPFFTRRVVTRRKWFSSSLDSACSFKGYSSDCKENSNCGSTKKHSHLP